MRVTPTSQNGTNARDEYQKVASTVGDLKWKIEVNDATIDKLEALIATRTAEKERPLKTSQR